MQAEYLIFNIFIFMAPLLLTVLRPQGVRDRWRRALVASSVVALPFVVWDALVAGRHWWFSELYTMGHSFVGLPMEEVMFFFSVPLACVFTWECMANTRERLSLAWIYALAPALLGVGLWQWSAGHEYTSLATSALAVAIGLDLWMATLLLLRPRFMIFGGLVLGLTGVFNGYLTARPVVLYDAAYQLDFRIVTIPVEDFVYGLALVLANVVLFEWLARGRASGSRRGLIARLIEARLGGYVQRFNHAAVDPSAAPRLGEGQSRRVLVVGGGLAGISAASALAERGVSVTLREKHNYLGGKVGAWTERLADGEEAEIEHGFHAFFRNYYNLREFLERIGVTQHFREIADYKIITTEREFGFRGASTTPALNLLSLARRGLYNLREVALGPAGQEMEAFLRYEREATFEKFDDMSFEDFATRAELPPELRLVFTTFSRAFFADTRLMSMAALIKSFHFYYLSNDKGLLYDYLDDDNSRTLIEPITRHLLAHGVDLRLSSPVQDIARAPEGTGFVVDGERYDDVVVASDVVGTRAILEPCAFVREEDPALHERLGALRPGQGYAVLRLWLDRDAARELPVFVSTDRVDLLDSITLLHRQQAAARAWSQETGGSLIELHCYALPEGLEDRAEITRRLIAEYERFLPEMAGAKVLREHLQVRRDFPAFHVGMQRSRPGVETGVDGLWLAGDWVSLPIPAMLMEGAYTSGLMCANGILAELGLQQAPVYTVPLEGMLVGVPQMPGSQKSKAA